MIAVKLGSAIEAVAIKRGLEPFRVIDEKRGVVFLAEFTKTYCGYCGGICREKSEVEKLGCGGTDGGVQPVLLVVDSNHGFIEGDVIRGGTASGL